MQGINANRIAWWGFWVLSPLLVAYFLLLVFYTPLEDYEVMKVEQSTTGVDKSFELFSPMPYSAGFGFEVDGQLFETNYVRANINKLPACTMRLTITPIFAVGQDERIYEFDCFRRYIGSYFGATYPPDDVILPIGFFKVNYSVQLDAPESHNVKLSVTYSGAKGGWSILYNFIHLMACYIMIPIYMVVAIFDAIIHPFK
jgi:hypothetical protein